METLRIKKAFWLSIFGLSLVAVLVIVLLAFGLRASSEIVAIVGLFTSVLGTLVGAFFGLQIGSAGKEKTQEQADSASKKASALLAAADDKMIEKARHYHKELFE